MLFPASCPRKQAENAHCPGTGACGLPCLGPVYARDRAGTPPEKGWPFIYSGSTWPALPLLGHMWGVSSPGVPGSAEVSGVAPPGPWAPWAECRADLVCLSRPLPGLSGRHFSLSRVRCFFTAGPREPGTCFLGPARGRLLLRSLLLARPPGCSWGAGGSAPVPRRVLSGPELGAAHAPSRPRGPGRARTCSEEPRRPERPRLKSG